MNKLNLKEENGYSYLETGGSSEVLLLLHGLLGELSNFDALIKGLSGKYNIVFPVMPINTMPLRKASLDGLLDFIDEFVNYKGFEKIHLLGNSLGGHLAQLYALQHPDRVATITLTGSSGLFENAMGSTFPKRGDYEYIKKKAEDTFYDPAIATKSLVDNIFEATTNRNMALRIIAVAKSAVRHNLADKLGDIHQPVLLIWGKQDGVTPPFVAEKFHDLLPDSELHFIDKCGHAPMMERPDAFNSILDDFLQRHMICTKTVER